MQSSELTHESAGNKPVVDGLTEAPIFPEIDRKRPFIARSHSASATGVEHVKGLEWSFVDIERKHAWIPGSKHKKGKPHSVPLNAMALSVLHKQIGKHPARMFTYGGQPIAQVNTKSWTKAPARAGIEDFRGRDPRHTFATWQRKAGTPTHEMQRFGGWKTGATVERCAHVAPEALQNAADRR